MCSQSSVQPVQPPVDPAALAAAIVAVAERSFFAYAEPNPPEHVISTAGGWFEATVRFRGPFCGHVAVALPVALAQELCAAFLGAEPDAPPDTSAVLDLTGEFSNMVCGTWLTGLAEASCFELAHPEVRAIDAAPAADIVVGVNDQPVVVVLRVSPESR